MRFMGESKSCSLVLLNKLNLQTKKKKYSITEFTPTEFSRFLHTHMGTSLPKI